MKRVAAGLGALVTLSTPMISVVPARAYALNGCYWPGGVNGLQYSDQTPLGYQPSDAAWAWTNTPTPIYFVPNAAGPIVTQAQSFGNTGWDGISYPICNGSSQLINVSNYYNRSYTDGYAQNHKQAVMVHKLGHALGLAHAGVTACPTPIMYYEAVACGDNTPQPDDINGIHALYG